MSNLKILPDGSAWSYSTRLIQPLPDGRTVGNVTKYSVTTSCHQSKAHVHECDVLVDGVPKGAIDLTKYVKE